MRVMRGNVFVRAVGAVGWLMAPLSVSYVLVRVLVVSPASASASFPYPSAPAVYSVLVCSKDLGVTDPQMCARRSSSSSSSSPLTVWGSLSDHRKPWNGMGWDGCVMTCTSADGVDDGLTD